MKRRGVLRTLLVGRLLGSACALDAPRPMGGVPQKTRLRQCRPPYGGMLRRSTALAASADDAPGHHHPPGSAAAAGSRRRRRSDEESSPVWWRFLTWYDAQLRRAPLRTKMISSGAVSAVGDAAAQTLTNTASAWGFGFFDARRSAAWAACGALYFAPFLHAWYNTLARLERRAIERYNTPKPVTVFAQLVTNQTVGAAVINLGFFFVFEIAFAVIALMTRYHPPGAAAGGVVLASWVAPAAVLARATANARAKFASIMLANWLVWPLPSLANLIFVPLQYRVLFTNAVALVWKCILSMLTSRQHPV